MTLVRRTAAIALVASLALLSAGCSSGSNTAGPSHTAKPSPSATRATPTPSATPIGRPTLASLRLSPDGLGTLQIGEAPGTDPTTRMVSLDPNACDDQSTGADNGVAAGSPSAALWVTDPSYAATTVYGPPVAFAVAVTGQALSRIDIYSASLPTTAGIHLGSTLAEVKKAYPHAAVVTTTYTQMYVVEGRRGRLYIEVSDQDSSYWGADELGVVKYLRAVRTSVAPFSVAATEDVLGSCSS